MSKQTDLINIPDAITVDGSGTAGFGVTPSPWRSLYGDKQVDIGAHSSVYSEAGNTTYLANNFYRNASNAFIYKTTSGASYVSLSQEKVIFAGAASGTAGNSFSFSERARFDSDGLKFNGDTAAANALNDYEEGTFTVGFQGATVSANNTTASYTKIGDLVTWYWYSSDTTISSASGAAYLTGLPFTVLNTNNNYNPAPIAHNTYFGGSTSVGQQAYHLVGNTKVVFNTIGQSNNPAFVNGSGKFLMIQGSYKTAS